MTSDGAAHEDFASVFLGAPFDLLPCLFMALCSHKRQGVVKLVYLGRSICKAWNRCVDELTERDFSALYSAAFGDSPLAVYVARLPALPAEAVQIVELPNGANVAPAANMFRRAALSGRRSESIDPSMWALLNRLATLALAAACKPQQGQSFARAFSMDLRGYSYYAVFEEQRANRADLAGKLLAWWRQVLRVLMERVQAQSLVSEADARAILRGFVEKMNSVPFHACRSCNQISFRDEGLSMLDAWKWP